MGTIEIPGLGTLALGHTKGKATGHYAEANAYALKIQVDNPQDGSKTVLQLGRATSRITDGVESGVFRSTMSALDLQIGDLVQFAGVSPQNIPCSGTDGNVEVPERRRRVGARPGQPVRREVLAGWASSCPRARPRASCRPRSAAVEIPAAQIVINGLTLAGRPEEQGPQPEGQAQGDHVARLHHVAGAPITLAPGESTPSTAAIMRYQIVQNGDFYGTEVRALGITLFEQNVVLTLGQSAGRIFFR